MKVIIANDKYELGKSAATMAADLLTRILKTKGYAHIIMATGSSQFETISHLVERKDIEWDKVTMFHLDEYIGLSEKSHASFRKYLKERFIDKITPLKACYLINGEADPVQECSRLNTIMREHSIDLAFVGIGENGHLAFNDPPADFDTEAPFMVVDLDEQCRFQQYNEGWFESMEDVPKQAISMSVQQIMRSKYIVCSVPESRKAVAVKNCLQNAVSNLYPASILQQHPGCFCFLDKSSSRLLDQKVMK
jgi:glucosamine-6-phosphate deaminase